MISDDLDMVIITESWINENLLGDRMQDYAIDNYDMFAYQREIKMGGGILVYIKRKLGPIIINIPNKCKEIESLWIDVFPDAGQSNKIRIGAFYRPPNQSRQLDLAMIDEIESGVT